MPVKPIISVAILGLAILGLSPVQKLVAADLNTLFTTPQERQIINSNRYKDVIQKPTSNGPKIELPKQELIKEEVIQEYKISGIAISSDGPPTVWINAVAYEDGEVLEDKSKVKIFVGDNIRVRITAPDGKKYYATSGETLEITYLVEVESNS